MNLMIEEHESYGKGQTNFVQNEKYRCLGSMLTTDLKDKIEIKKSLFMVKEAFNKQKNKPILQQRGFTHEKETR